MVMLSLLLGGALAAARGWHQPAAPLAWVEVHRDDFVAGVRASGEIRAVRSVNLSAPYIRGRLQIIALVPDGARVKKGDVLCQFDPAEIEKQREDYRLRLRQVQEEIERRRMEMSVELGAVEVELKRAEFALERARLRYEATKQLLESGLKAPTELRDAELNLTEAELVVQQIRRKIAAVRRSHEAQLAVLGMNRRYAEAALALAERHLTALTLRAPMDGLVVLNRNPQTRQKVQMGDAVWPGMTLMSLPDLSRMEVVLEVNEMDIGSLRIGQGARVRLDAYPGSVFKARVKQIASLARKRDWQSPIKVFDVILELEETDPRMRPGMTVSADVIVERIPQVLVVPHQAVFEKEGQAIVYVIEGRRIQMRRVRTGRRNWTHVIIEEGLREGERVALRDPTAEREGEQTEKFSGVVPPIFWPWAHKPRAKDR